MADELADRTAVATLLLDASITLDDLARRLSTTDVSRHDVSAELSLWSERLAAGTGPAMDPAQA